MLINLPSVDPAPNSSGGCASGQCGNGLEKVYPTAAVRYGYMQSVGEFRYPTDRMRFGCGASVVIQSNRGIEIGEMVSLTCDGCDKCVSREQIKKYLSASGPEYYSFSNGRILRLATEADLQDWDHIRAETLHKKAFCQHQADTSKLPMKVLECEHLFGGERIIFYFMSEGRVDFRALVKGLATEYQTRIEMRQVGARDEARLLADYETCGRECCCKNFLKTLKPVSMKMAKMQKATLDPAKVSGRCGRLKCCLRYEHTNYEELDRQLPRFGSRVFTESGKGSVVGRQILTQLLQIQTEDGGRLTVPLEDLITEEAMIKIRDAKAAAAVAAIAAARSASKAAKRPGASSGRRRGGRGSGPQKQGDAKNEKKGGNQSKPSASKAKGGSDGGEGGDANREGRSGTSRSGTSRSGPPRTSPPKAGKNTPPAPPAPPDVPTPQVPPAAGDKSQGSPDNQGDRPRKNRRRRSSRGRRGQGGQGGEKSGGTNSS